jgi:hypothetical protein
MTKTERLNWMYGLDALRQIEFDVHQAAVGIGGLPTEWHSIWDDRDNRRVTTTRVTCRLDTDVVKFFKAMGPGYQPKMNRVLRSYMHFRLAKIVQGPDTSDYVLRPQEVLREVGKRVEWGETEERLK